jgi:PAS domain S-box-containing protein
MNRLKKILIVEDESIIALTIESTLINLGYQVIGYVDSGEKCLEFVKNNPPDLILMDVKINGTLTGIDTAKIISTLLDIPIIFLTAFSSPELIKEVKEVNPFGYIVKPFNPRDLFTTIELALSKYEYEKKLIASENKYKNLVETINEGILQLNASTCLVDYVNSAFCEMLELNYDDVINTDSSQLYFIKDQKDFFSILKENRKLGVSEKYEVKIITKSGMEKCFLVSGAPIKNEEGNIAASLTVWLDISDNKRQLNQLKKFYNAIEQSEELILITDKNGIIEYINCTFCKVTGFTQKELLGKTLKMLNSGKHNKLFYQNLWDIINSGKSFSGEFINKKKNGDLYYEEKIISPLINENGILTNFISTGRDITEKILTLKKVEAFEKLQAFNEKKQARIRTYSLIKGQEDERQRISRDLHDGLGQILTAAKINLEKLNIKEITKHDKYKDLEKVYDLVNETINEVRRISYDLSPSTLNDFGIISAVRTIIAKANETQFKIKINLTTNITSERFDRDIEINIYRIIQEAINNAIKHANCTLIKINIHLCDNLLDVSINDNGIGFEIPKNISYLENHKFNNGLKNIKERGNIIGGKIEITSSLNNGTEISFNTKIKAKKNDKNYIS